MIVWLYAKLLADSNNCFYCFCSCGMKDPQGIMPSRQIKGKAWLETLGCLDGMNALKELIPQECFLCFCQKKQFFNSGSKIATSFCAIRYIVPCFFRKKRTNFVVLHTLYYEMDL